MASDSLTLPALSRLRKAFPAGGALEQAAWERRHRAVVFLVGAHAVGILLYALGLGEPLVHGSVEGGVVLALALAALFVPGPRWLRSGLATTGLFAASALIVHLSHGVIEMHFHFFFVVALLSIYHEWMPFGLAIVYFLAHHLVYGVIAPEDVWAHEGAMQRPWLWAGIHSAFFIGACLASLLAWRQSEVTHAKAEAASQRLYAEQLRHKQALEINDNVVQGLAVTKYALDTGNHEYARAALQGTLGSARQIVTELLEHDEEIPLGPGDLIRLDPAVVVAPTE